MPQRHTAVRVYGFNEQDPASACKVESIDTPKPGPGQVLVKMLCRPINPSDILCIQGKYAGGPSNFPFVAGFEGAGQIYEIGENVSGFQVGQRVFHLTYEGSWQEFCSVAAESLIPVPESVPNEVAAQFFINPWTAYGMLEELEVPNGEYVLQTAAASVLGRMFIQLAHHRGIKTINIVRRNEQKDELKSLGADVVINSKEENVMEQVKKVTNGSMAFGAIDCVGGEMTKVVCSSVRDGGTVLVYGALDGFEASIDISDLVFRDVKVHGFHLTKWLGRKTSADQQAFSKIGATIMELLAKRVLTPIIGEKFQLQEVSQAIRKSQAAARGGKVLLVSE